MAFLGQCFILYANQDNKNIAPHAIEVFRMHYINEFRLVGKILNIGKIFTYANGTQILICNVQTVVNGETMNHSVNFYDELAQELTHTAFIGQQISIDGSLMAIEHLKDGETQTYFGVKANHFYLLASVKSTNYRTTPIPPLPNNNQQRQPNRSNTSIQSQPNQTQRKQINTQAQRQPTPNTASNPNQAQRQPRPNTAPKPNQAQRQSVQQDRQNNQTQVNLEQNNYNWADDCNFDFQDHQNTNQTNNQFSASNVEEMVLVGQDAKPQQTIHQQASIGGVPIDLTLPFAKR